MAANLSEYTNAALIKNFFYAAKKTNAFPLSNKKHLNAIVEELCKRLEVEPPVKFD